jgi:regulator of nucleoside diphosphate kinase
MEHRRAALIVSSTDFERLERLLEDARYRDAPGASALRDELERAEIVEPAAIPGDVVTMNSVVRIVADDGKERELALVYPRAADGSPDKVSILAPVGSAMLGLKVGESIDWPMPGGRHASVRILGIRFQPEASGEMHR